MGTKEVWRQDHARGPLWVSGKAEILTEESYQVCIITFHCLLYMEASEPKRFNSILCIICIIQNLNNENNLRYLKKFISTLILRHATLFLL